MHDAQYLILKHMETHKQKAQHPAEADSGKQEDVLDTSESTQQEDARQGNIVRAVWTGAIIVFCIAGYFAWKMATAPSVGQITYSGTDVAKLSKAKGQAGVETEDSEKKQFNGKYVSFSYDTSYAMKKHEDLTQKKENILETAYFSQTSINSSKIAVTIETMEGRKVEDFSAYVLRKSKPAEYAEGTYDFGKTKGVVFTGRTQGKYEKLYFITNGKYMAELAFSSTRSEIDQLDREVDALARGLQLK